ncbi:DUF11 domain-containing protein [Mariniblastus fucicola]|uniref:Large cysteine-rich periplasmic protein OmcB n=1 Tax=Mariniblastus fucicola TaxID=980251 RepID=A0A5B9PAJ3_9BACT|nr:DUF11 domain-containing protein [Mariniblastus fucicola]QEG21516.1 Large cysteine-rich periplasmic protein OmcB [Mariniblastus fucicola]
MTENETTDQDTSETTASRGNGALIGRFLAVGLFVALGTFAVIQSLSGERIPEDPGTDKPGADSVVAEAEDKDTDVKSIVDAPVIKRKETFGGSVANTTPSMKDKPNPNGPSKFAKTFKPATTPATITKRQAPGTFDRPTISTSQTKTPPPNRIAQLETGSARNTFGIGGPATTPGTAVQKTIGDAAKNLKDKVGDATSSVSNRFNQMGNSLKDTAGDVTNRAKSTFGSSTASRFGAPSQTKAPEVASSGSPFGQKSPEIKQIEAKPTLDSMPATRPFAASQPKPSGFQSKSLNPISSTSPQQTRTPSATPATRPGSTFPPSKSSAASTPARNPFGQKPTVQSLDRPSTGGLNAKTSSTFQNSGRNTSLSPSGQTRMPNSASQPRTQTPARTQLPSASTRPPMVQASRVSSKPGDRQFEGVQSPSMIIQKFSPNEIQVNQTADFEVKIRNVGRVSVDDVLVVDQVPEGARFIDANPKPSSQSRNGELQWQLGTMKPGEERTILLQLQPTVPGEIGSVAQFYFGGRASNRTKVTQPKLTITHTADPKILIGNNVEFDVTVENTGNGPAHDVIIQEEVPELLEFQDGSRELEYEIGTLMPGQSRRVRLGLRAARVGRLRNVMFASAKGGLQAKHETDVEIIAPKLTTSSEGPTTRYIQRQVAHTFTVGNQGTAAATNLRLIARLPSGLRFVSANNRGQYDRNSHAVIWQMRDLNAGSSGDVEVVTSPVEAGEQNIKFEAEADLNQKSETMQKLNVLHLVDVFFDIDDVVDPIEIGADTRYRISLVNQGTQAATNVQLQIDFPSGLEPTSVDGDLRNQIRNQQVLFEPITSLRPGEELNVIVQAKGRADGDHRVVVTMKAGTRATPVSKEETTRVYSDR